MTRDCCSNSREVRTEREILEDLQQLAQSQGALHSISTLVHRDVFVKTHPDDGHVLNDPEERWSPFRLNTNELCLLMGLMVQSETNHIYRCEPENDVFSARADKLFRELHNRILAPADQLHDSRDSGMKGPFESFIPYAQEAIYYGNEGYYLHQFEDLGRERYRSDCNWLIENIGISIDQMFDMARFLAHEVNLRMTHLHSTATPDSPLKATDITDSLLVPKADLRQKFGTIAESFCSQFVTSVTNTNGEFTNPFSTNVVLYRPIIEFEGYLYLPVQRQLFRSIYESPWFWMNADKHYKNRLATNRGTFTESKTARILESVFSGRQVHRNVEIVREGHDSVGEIDTLVVFGEFMIIVQAKSKRVTQEARAGDPEAMKRDFKKAIQEPYLQALRCIEAITAGGRCISKDHSNISIPTHPRFIPLVVLCDSFPSSSILSHFMLERANDRPPIVWDLGVLDCVARVLDKPFGFLYFLTCRADVFGRMRSRNELNYLGLHLQSPLPWVADGQGGVLENVSATAVDNFMISADNGVDAARPTAKWESLRIPVIRDLIEQSEHANPVAAPMIFDLYSLPNSVLWQVSHSITNMRNEVVSAKEPIREFSFCTYSGGITYVVTPHSDKFSVQRARALGAEYKLQEQRDRWLVILDSVDTGCLIDMWIPLV